MYNELYDLVWTEVTTRITDKLDISSYRLYEICKEHEIPVPKNDYWTMEDLGRLVRPPLPVDDKIGDDSIIDIVSDLAIHHRRLSEIRRKIEEACKDYLQVLKRLTSPDSLIRAAKYTLDHEEIYTNWRNRGLRKTKSGQVQVSVSKKNIGRSLRILDTFIKLVKSRGYEIRQKYSALEIFIEEEGYEFGIREKQKRTYAREGYLEYVPTGQLILFVGPSYDRREWVDGSKPIELHLSKALAYLEKDAEERAESEKRNELLRIEREKKESVFKQIHEKEKQDKLMFEELINMSEKWHQSRILREFLNCLEQELNKREEVTEKTY